MEGIGREGGAGCGELTVARGLPISKAMQTVKTATAAGRTSDRGYTVADKKTEHIIIVACKERAKSGGLLVEDEVVSIKCYLFRRNLETL